MKLLLMCYVLVGVFIAAPITAGMMYHELQGMWIESGMRDKAVQRQRRHLGDSVMFGLLSIPIWPIAMPMMFCMTGFAENGIFHQRETTP